jgi:hypothetical protein
MDTEKLAVVVQHGLDMFTECWVIYMQRTAENFISTYWRKGCNMDITED